MQDKCKQHPPANCKYHAMQRWTRGGFLRAQTNKRKPYHRFIDWVDNSTAGTVLALVVLTTLFVALWVITP